MSLLKKFWNDTAVKGIAGSALVFAIVWSIAWSIQDGALNLVPFAFAIGGLGLMFFMYWLFRNNP